MAMYPALAVPGYARTPCGKDVQEGSVTRSNGLRYEYATLSVGRAVPDVAFALPICFRLAWRRPSQEGQWNDYIAISAIWMVGVTGIEPVTPTMST